MKLIFLLLFPLSSFALNRTFMQMPPDRAYMNFVTTKFMTWHRKNFSFPEDSALLRELTGSLDHWLVPGLPLRQWTVSHSEAGGDEKSMSLRIFIQPALRGKKEFTGVSGKAPSFVEWNDKGRTCLVFPEKPDFFSAWCKTGKGKYIHEWDEQITSEIPLNWKITFPYLGDRYLEKLKDGKVIEVTFFDVSVHPSRIPAPLMRSVFLHTKDALLPLDHVSTQEDGRMTVHYP